MKLLIAYDGSRCSEAALDDLARAGLPRSGEAMVLSVAEVWLPPPAAPKGGDPYIEGIVAKYREKGQRVLAEAETFSKHAHARVSRLLPDWAVTHMATYGSPAWEILTASVQFQADLIVVGSNGQSAISRAVLGSVSQKVSNSVECTVVIVR